jgi:Fe-S cluster assembly protein SufD
MRHAYEIFEKLDTPGGSEEAWKYVESDLSFDFDLVDTPGDPLPEGRFLRALTADAGRATLVDGHTVLASGPRLTAVSELDDSRQVEIHSLLPPDHDRFAAARTAFSTDGIEVEIPAGTVEEAPVVIDVQAVTPGASFPAISVRVGENAEGSVVVVYRSPAELDALTSPQVGLHVAQGGRLRYLAIQNFGFATTAVIHQRAQVGRDASLRVGEVGLGGRLGRLDLGVLLEGDGGSVEVVGLSFGEHDQILDYRMTITHRGRSTSSDVYLKGAVEDRARSIFTGLLKIEKQAARSSAFETNRNLVLSEHAKAHSVPNLEILCDDVVCGHGSSVGPLDEDQIYYLLSRGLSRARAERLLVKGFFSEVVDRLPVQGPAEQVLDEVFGRFVEAQAEGRLG